MSARFTHWLTTFLAVTWALVGAWTSGVLVADHAGGWQTGDQAGSSLLHHLCESPNLPSASCTEVVDSRWGSFDVFFAGRRILVPMSLLGLAYFVGVAIWFAVLAPIRTDARWTWRLTFIGLAGGLTVSVLLTALMVFVLPQSCPLCLIAHAANLAVVLTALWMWWAARRDTGHAETDPSQRVRWLQGRMVLTAIIGAMAAAVALWLYFDAATEVRRQWRKLHELRQVVAALQNDRDFVLREYQAQPVIDELAAQPVATATLVVFTRFDCPACDCFDKFCQHVLRPRFGDDLLIDLRHLPPAEFDPQQDQQTPNGWAASALAAEAAGRQNDLPAYLAFRRLLFEQRRSEGPVDYAELARLAGLDTQRLIDDMVSESVRQTVSHTAKQAKRLGINETPAVFLDGRRVPDLCIKSRVFWAVMAERFKAASPTNDQSTSAESPPAKGSP